MIFDSEPWFVSIEPGTCFWRTKFARKSMNALGGRGMYPCERRLPGGCRRRVGGGAGVSAGGKRASLGDGTSAVRSSPPSVSSTKVPGVTFGANVTFRGDVVIP